MSDFPFFFFFLKNKNFFSTLFAYIFTAFMLDFAVLMTEASYEIAEEDREVLREVGFSDRDIFDIASVAGFFNMTNRVASAVDMRPNPEYHAQAR